MRYHDAENWPLLREALVKMGRADLIGHGPQQLDSAGKRRRAPGAAKSVRAPHGKPLGKRPTVAGKPAVTAASNAEKTGRR